MPSADAIVRHRGIDSGLSSSGSSSSSGPAQGRSADAIIHDSGSSSSSSSSGSSSSRSSSSSSSRSRSSSRPAQGRSADAIIHDSGSSSSSITSTSSSTTKQDDIRAKIIDLVNQGKSAEEIKQELAKQGVEVEAYMARVVRGDMKQPANNELSSALNQIDRKVDELNIAGQKAKSPVERVIIGAELAVLGFAAGIAGTAGGLYSIGKRAASGDVVGAATEAISGTIEWVKSIPETVYKSFTSPIGPYYAGKLAGEVLTAEVFGRTGGKVAGKVKNPLRYVPAEKLGSLTKITENTPSTLREPLTATPEEIKAHFKSNKVYHATSADIPSKTKVLPGNSPTKGLYVGPEPYFTFAIGRAVYEGLPRPKFLEESKPSVLRIETKGVEIPGRKPVTPEELQHAQRLVGRRTQSPDVIKQFAEHKKFVETSGEAKAYISPEATAGVPWRGQIEVEAVIPHGIEIHEGIASRILRKYTEAEVSRYKMMKEAKQAVKELQKKYEELYKKNRSGGCEEVFTGRTSTSQKAEGRGQDTASRDGEGKGEV